MPSALIAFAGLSSPARSIGHGFDHLLGTTWKVADDVGPAAKLLLGLTLALLFLASSRVPARAAPLRYAINGLAGCTAMMVTLALIPAALSRGFGVGLTSARFDPASLPLYLIGGTASGLVFAFSLFRCERNQVEKGDRQH